MSGFQPKSKRAALSDGAMAPGLGFPGKKAAQAQVLNQAPDSIPGMFKPGEFVLPPDTVHAMGGKEALNQVVQATHTPAPSSAMVPRGFKPEVFFANGGAPEDELQRMQNQSAMYVRGAQEAAANRPPVPANPSATASAASAPTSTPSSSAGFMPGTRAVFNESGKAISDLAGQGRYGAAAGETARAALAYVPAVADDVLGGAWRAVAPTAADAVKQFLGVGDTDVPSAAKVPSPPRTAATAVAGSVLPPSESPSNSPPAAPPPQPPVQAQPQGSEVQPGVYEYGRGRYSDNAAGMGFNPGFTGQPSTQNMAAADALAARQAPGGFNPTGVQASGVQAPVVRNSTNDWAARNALRNAEVSAGSIMNRKEWNRAGVADSEGKVAGFRAAQAADLALQQAQPGMDLEAMRQNAGLQREGIQQNGATTRTGIQEQGANTREAGRTAVARGELGLKQTAAGFQTRAAQQLETLQTKYTAETDAAKRAELARQIREVQGKEQPARYKVAAGGQQIDANGVAYKVPDRVFNEQTGQFADGTGAPSVVRTPDDLAKLPKGAQFMDEQGRMRVKN